MPNFVYDLTDLPGGKVDLIPPAPGADLTKYIPAAHWNACVQASLDLRSAIRAALFHGFEPQAVDPLPEDTDVYFWLDESGHLTLQGADLVITGALSASGTASAATPTLGPHLTTKDYVDSKIRGLLWKESVVAATTGPVILTGEQTIDDIPLVDGNRILVKNQGDATQNGIYAVKTGSWIREPDLAVGAHAANVTTSVSRGTVNGDYAWTCTSDYPNDVVGTHALTWVQFSTTRSYGVQGSVPFVAASGDLITDHDDLAWDAALKKLSVGGKIVGLTQGTVSGEALHAGRQVGTSAPLTGGGALTGDLTLGLQDSGVEAGTYNSVTVDAKGIVTDGTSEGYILDTRHVDTASGRLSGGGALSSDLTLDLAELDPDPSGTYAYLAGTIDKYGRVTGAAAAPLPVRQYVALSLNERCTSSTWQVLSDFPLNPATYPSPATVRFQITMFITNDATTGYAKLYNLTDGADVTDAGFSLTGSGGLAPTTFTSPALTLPAGEKVYEVRVQLTGGAPTDELDVQWAGFRIDQA